MTHSLEADSIILAFGNKRVLQDVYLKNETGKITGILGRNGAGKSCLLKIIFGELETYNKSIRFDGEAISNGFRRPDNIRYLPQFNFIPTNLKVKRIFRDFNLEFSDFLNHFPDFGKYYNFRLNMLSGGERRIFEIYAILASETKFCMLDEPFSHVMPVHIESIKDVFNQQKKKKGIIITDHMYEHIMDISDDLYVITNGKTYRARDRDDLVSLGYISENSKTKL